MAPEFNRVLETLLPYQKKEKISAKENWKTRTSPPLLSLAQWPQTLCLSELLHLALGSMTSLLVWITAPPPPPPGQGWGRRVQLHFRSRFAG